MMNNNNNNNNSSNKKIRKRPVTFGNPSLGTYHGVVYTLEGGSGDNSSNSSKAPPPQQQPSTSTSNNNNNNNNIIVEDAMYVERLVAMVNVPPEQVPEGVLNLARAHRPWIDHVRIVIEDTTITTTNNHDNNHNAEQQQQQQQQDGEEETKTNSNSSTILMMPSPTASAAESAASILAAEQRQRTTDDEAAPTTSNGNKSNITDNNTASVGTTSEQINNNNNEKDNKNNNKANDQQQPQLKHQSSALSAATSSSSRSYLVLFGVCSNDAAKQLVEYLDGEPYTCLDETQICCVQHVIALHGEDGVSLMSPFFAAQSTPSTTTATTTTTTTTNSVVVGGGGSGGGNGGSGGGGGLLEILPSTSTDSSSNSAAAAPTAHSGGGGGGDTTKGTGQQQHTHRNANTTITKPSHPPAEDYNCPVCLEHMQLDRSSISGGENNKGGAGGGEWTSILTTVCNHSFHMDCLLQWQDSPCPVCRYDHSGLNEALSQCQVCGRTENIFVCLICGVVSCGRGSNSNSSTSSRLAAAAGHQQPSSSSISASSPSAECSSSTTPDCTTGSSNDAAITSSSEAAAVSSSHARQHYDETLHAYALDTETQHVWDHSGHGYVHRLLQNKEDGKLVEVNDPSNTASQERSLNPGLSTRQEGEVVHRKLEGFASQYYTLLKSQLEQQRIYYEGRLEEIRREHEYKDNGGRHHHHSSRKKGTSDLINALKQERHQLSQRLSCLGNRYRKVRDDAAFLKSMNESLEANKSLLKKQLAAAQLDRVEAKRALDACIPPLQEKVTVLMLQLESEMTAAAEAAAAAEAKAAQPSRPQLLSGEDSKKPAA